ncbi:hypothetical protein [Rubritalea squalenifaciens]|uniref:hypothetical protein n=1 Tax=Rubritalea squalenifaciens TaxID=407226 RepID=UPI001160F128|nr:hypothetical protein [Rubritalea squalenifaciens]
MYVYVPTASLENAAASDQVYLYTSFGGFKYEGEAQNSMYGPAALAMRNGAFFMMNSLSSYHLAPPPMSQNRPV